MIQSFYLDYTVHHSSEDSKLLGDRKCYGISVGCCAQELPKLSLLCHWRNLVARRVAEECWRGIISQRKRRHPKLLWQSQRIGLSGQPRRWYTGCPQLRQEKAQGNQHLLVREGDSEATRNGEDQQEQVVNFLRRIRATQRLTYTVDDLYAKPRKNISRRQQYILKTPKWLP